MKYRSINELDEFNLHDAELEKIDFHNNSMLWRLKNVNVTKKNTQNNENDDMCVDIMEIVFENIEIKNLIWLDSGNTDDNANLINETLNPKNEQGYFMEEIKRSLNSFCYIFGHKKVESQDISKYLFTMNSKKGVYEFLLVFENIIAEWDEFKGKAWYVNRPQ